MRTLSNIVGTRPIVAQIYLSPQQSLRSGEVTQGVGFMPNIPTAIPEQLLGLIKTDGDRHVDFAAAGIGERIITAAVTRPTYGTRYRQETSRPLKFLGLVPVHASVPQRYRSGEEAVPYAELAEIADNEVESAVVVGYDLMSRAFPLSSIHRDIHDRPGNRSVQGLVLPASEARELTSMLRGDPNSIRELSHLALERVTEGLGAVPAPDYSQWPAGIDKVQFTCSVQAGSTDPLIVTMS